MCLFVAKNRKAGFWTGLSRLAEAFSLDWLPSSPRQPHSPLDRILFKTAAPSIAERRSLNFLMIFLYSNYGILLLDGTPAHLFAIRPSKRLVLIRTCDGTGIVVSVAEALALALDQTNAWALIFNESA